MNFIDNFKKIEICYAEREDWTIEIGNIGYCVYNLDLIEFTVKTEFEEMTLSDRYFYDEEEDRICLVTHKNYSNIKNEEMYEKLFNNHPCSEDLLDCVIEKVEDLIAEAMMKQELAA